MRPLRPRQRLSTSIDYLLAILSPRDVAEAVRRYITAQSTDALLLHVRRSIRRMKAPERWAFASIFGSTVERSENPLFDRAAPSEAELMQLAESSLAQLHERFSLFLQRNPRALTTLDSDAIDHVLRPLATDARLQAETPSRDGIAAEEIGRSFTAVSSIRFAALRERLMAVPSPSPYIPVVACGAVLLALAIAVSNYVASQRYVAHRFQLRTVHVAVQPHIAPRTVTRATAAPTPAPVRRVALVATPPPPTPSPTAQPTDTPTPSALDAHLASEALPAPPRHLPDIVTASAASAMRRLGAAPADESFGRLSQTVLGIRNQLDAFDAATDGDMQMPSAMSKLGDLQDELLAWQRQYPNDPWLPRSLSRLVKDYARAGEASSPQATQVLHVMQDDYPAALDAQTTRATSEQQLKELP